MKKWSYLEPGENDEPVTHTFTEAEILDTYYAYWCGQMLRVHKAPMITEANCIEDFVVVHWAWEAK